jgi:hypothetical protein
MSRGASSCQDQASARGRYVAMRLNISCYPFDILGQDKVFRYRLQEE